MKIVCKHCGELMYADGTDQELVFNKKRDHLRKEHQMEYQLLINNLNKHYKKEE